MIRAIATFFVTLVLGLSLAASPAFAGGQPPKMLGPGDANVHDVHDMALIRWSKFGFVYIAGKQNSHLTITFDKDANALRYKDTGTKRLGKIPNSCHRQKAQRGIAAVCKIPASFAHRNMFVQVWPRLGNDFVDGRTLPHKFRLWALVDAGRDVVYGGARQRLRQRRVRRRPGVRRLRQRLPPHRPRR